MIDSMEGSGFTQVFEAEGDGRFLWRTTAAYRMYRPGMAPRMPSYECECRRSGSREQGWRIDLCAKHTQLPI